MVDFGPHTEPHPDVAGYLLGTLEPSESQRFADHLIHCDACRSEVHQLAETARLLSEASPPVSLPEGLEARTLAAVEAATVADRQSEAGAHGGAVIPIHQPQKRGRRRPPMLLLVAAALLVVGLTAGILVSRSTSTAPLATVELTAVGGGTAHGTATLHAASAGATIDMTVENLAPSPAGTFYTCWLVGPGDTLAHPNRVSVGSFVVRGAGPVHVHWTTAADVRRFSQLGVTREPDNGNPSHQGPRVLAGTVGPLI
jgi:hypothetical protein